MSIRLTKHQTVFGIYYYSGAMLRLCVFDHVLEDGRLVIHDNYGKYEILPKDSFAIVYDSFQELEAKRKK